MSLFLEIEIQGHLFLLPEVLLISALSEATKIQP